MEDCGNIKLKKYKIPCAAVMYWNVRKIERLMVKKVMFG